MNLSVDIYEWISTLAAKLYSLKRLHFPQESERQDKNSHNLLIYNTKWKILANFLIREKFNN